mmetsp:Transcript_29703/g.77054  ORF Transcript_29703/g.77054 Transcript_29703/m.77054 type:complete len:180 (+) Transcript_29703:3-542(+)
MRYETGMRQAEAETTSIVHMPSEYVPLSRFVFASLISLVEGVPLEFISSIGEHNGFEACRRLFADQRRRLEKNQLQRVEGLLNPEFGGSAGFRAKWVAWERQLEMQGASLGGAFTDTLKIAVVRRKAPAELARHLRVTAGDYGGDYAKFRLAVGGYLMTCATTTTSSLSFRTRSRWRSA